MGYKPETINSNREGKQIGNLTWLQRKFTAPTSTPARRSNLRGEQRPRAGYEKTLCDV